LKATTGLPARAALIAAAQNFEPALTAAIHEVEEKGFCAAAWQPEVVAVATALRFKGSLYALNVSLSTAEPLAAVVRDLAPTLLALRARIQRELDAATHAG
jgi:DNA-binding IclR family transcriptional regulator